MPIDASLLTAAPDATAQQARGFSYADQVAQNAAKYQAGAKFAQGDYTGAAQTQAQAGNIPEAQKLASYGAALQAGGQFSQGNYAGAAGTQAKAGDIEAAQNTQAFGQKTAVAGQSAIAQTLPVFQQIAAQHANDPDKGAAALGQAFDYMAPHIQAATGIDPQRLAAARQQLVADPNGFLSMLQKSLPVEVSNVGNNMVARQGTQATSIYQAPEFKEQPFGSTMVPANQAAADSVNNSQAAPSGAGGQPPAASAGQPPLGIRSNNPGNLQPNGKEATFSNSTAGILEASRNLDSYAAQGINTIAGIVSKWAPPTDATGKPINDTPAYIASVSKQLGVDANTPLNLHDSNVKGALLEAIFHQENGAASPPPRAQIGQPIGGGGFKGPDPEAIKNDVGLYIASNGLTKPQYPMGTAGLPYKDAFDKQLNESMKEQNITPNDFASGLASRKADTASLQKLQATSDNVTAYKNNLDKNVAIVNSLLDKGAGGPSPLVNRFTQFVRGQGQGDKDVLALQLALQNIQSEYGKLNTGSMGNSELSVGAQDKMAKALSGNLSADDLRYVINKVVEPDGQNRVDTLNSQLSTIKQRLGGRAPGGGQVTPPPAAVDLLRKNPALRAQFDQKYGAGAAIRTLGQQ